MAHFLASSNFIQLLKQRFVKLSMKLSILGALNRFACILVIPFLVSCGAVSGDAVKSSAAQPAPAPLKIEKESIQWGGRRLDLTFEDRPAYIFLPSKASPEKPMRWAWYVYFDGYAPGQRQAWLFERILGAGMAIAAVNVGESYGSPAGIELQQKFFRARTAQFSLSPEVVLLPQSRGGLQFYNWAAQHSASVERIAGIYPVGDLRSYPGLDKAAPAYGLTSEQLEKELAAHNPIDLLDPIAKAGIPIFHIHGDSDTLVPLEANSGEIARRYRALGGSMELVVVAGKGHEEADEFFQSQRLLDFIIQEHPQTP